MNKKIIKLSIFLLSCFVLIFPRSAKAVIPPDFVFNIGTQIAQFFSMVVIFFLAILGAFFQFFKTKYYAIKRKKIFLSSVTFIIITIAIILSYFYTTYKQNSEYQKWLIESQKYAITQNNNYTKEEKIAQENNFFTENKNKNILLTNQELKGITNGQQTNYLVLDARENLEYENGHFPKSLHIRFADITAGQWTELPKDKFVYVICWSGIRGKETAEFLRTKNVVASYLENGASGWVEFGGQWIGNIKFSQEYADSKYQIVLDTEDVKNKVRAGVILVDTREPNKFNKSHIAGSVNIPTMYTPFSEMEKAFGQVPANSRVITVCDTYVNCFDAKITGVELERRGHQFLGRYNKPWEYEQ